MFLSSSEVRAQKIKSFGSGFEKLEEALCDLPDEVYDFRIRRDTWTINEIVIHLADNESCAYVNFRRAIAEPTETIMAFDKDLWAESLSYYSGSCKMSLKIFQLLRKSNYLLLKNLEESFWIQTVHYPDQGQVSLEDLLNMYEQHLKKAIDEIHFNAEAWRKSKA